MKEYLKHEIKKHLADIGGFEINDLETFYDNYGEELQQAHTHSFYEIVWFKEAKGTHTVDFQAYPIENNTFFFITPGQVHKYDNSRTKAIAIKFMPEFLNDESTTEDIFLKYSFFNAFDTQPYIVINNEELLRTLDMFLYVLNKEKDHPNAFGHHTYMQSLLKMLLIFFQRYDRQTDSLNVQRKEERTTLNMTNNVHQHFLRFRQTLEKEYRHIHNVQDYADLLGIGTKYLTTIVKECSNRTPLQLINDRILLEAKRQLRFSNKMVKEIAFDLGYEDPSYFVKTFKRVTGILPTEFREM